MKNQTFDSQMERIRFITGAETQAELVDLLGVRQSFISDAKRRGKIPSSWLVILIRCKNANPEWILTGNGPTFVAYPPTEPCYETADEAAERRADREALRRLASRLLADELMRRIAVSQDRMYCSRTGA